MCLCFKLFNKMNSMNNSSIIYVESPMRSPSKRSKRSQWSPGNRNIYLGDKSLNFQSSAVSQVGTCVQRLLFDSEDDGVSPPPTGRLLFGSQTPQKGDASPPPTGRLLFGFSDEDSRQVQFNSAKEISPETTLHTTYMVKLDTPPPPVPETKTPAEDDIKLQVPVSMFLHSLHERGVLSPLPSKTQAFSSPSTPPVGSGSFATAFQSPHNPANVMKISQLGPNGKKRDCSTTKVDNKELLKLLNASNKCFDNSNCAKVYEIAMYQNKDVSWMMCVEQEKCLPLTCDDGKAFLKCFIDLLRKFLPTGVYPKDFKVSNFGKNRSGKVVWLDFDFGTVNKEKPVPSIVSSGDFQFDENEQFQRLLLALIEIFCPPITSFFSPPLIRDRKDVFRILNQEKGLLQTYRLLSSDKSICETTMDDFIEVLRNIGLYEEDIAYLVGLLTPSASSQ